MKKSHFLLSLLLSGLMLAGCGKAATTVTQEVPKDPISESVTASASKTPEETTEQSPTASVTPTPSLPSIDDSIKVTDVILDRSSLTIAAGTSSTVTASVLPEDADDKRLCFLVSDPSIALVDQQGCVTGLTPGKTTLRVKAASGVIAQCELTVTEKERDPIDKLNYKQAEELWWTSCHGSGIDMSPQGDVLFTPNLWQITFTEEDRYRYVAYLRFTYLPQNKNESEYTFPSIKLLPEYTEEGYLIFNLKGKDVDSGFCPRGESSYRVELVLANAQNNRAMCYGTYEVTKSAKLIEYSPYYKPTPQPGFIEKANGQVLLSYHPTTGGQIDGQQSQGLFEEEQGSTVEAVALEGYRFFMWSDGNTSPTRTDKVANKNLTLNAYFIKETDKASPVADMYIFTETGAPVTKKSYEQATMIIVGAADPAHNVQKTLQIKGRGNSSWNPDAAQDDYDSKNSYRVKFDEKEQLLGLGDSKNKDWVLNSNKFDLSGLRNFLVWDLANRMNNFTYVPECTWVQLYVNCEYRGMYMVTEYIEVAKDRVEVDDTINSTDKGYFIEVDFRGEGEGKPYFHVKGYGKASNNNEREFVIKSQCTNEDVAYISQYIQQCNDAFERGDKAEIESLVDLQSLVDMYIIEELSKDVDVGAASFFLQKNPGGKLMFTAPWDFDFGFGTFERSVSAEGMISVNKSGCTWFGALLKQQWFRDMVLARMAELDDDFEATIGALRAQAEVLRPYADENAAFWNMYGTRYHDYVDKQVSSRLYSYDEHIDFLVNWTTARWQIMKDFISTYTPEIK